MISRADARSGPSGVALLQSADHLFADPLELTAPPWRDGLVERSTLVDALLASSAVPLVVITAPTGYGKTTTMAQWARSDSRCVGWVLLDELDNDPVRFVRHLALALDRIEALGDEVMDSLIGPAPGLGVVVPRLARSLRDGRSPFVLFIDDVHLLVNPASLEVLRTLVTRLPFGSQVVVGGRSTPDLSTARLRLEERVRHVGPDELAMDLGEAEQLYRFLGGDADPSDLPTLLRITEGWPAGIALAALASKGGRDASKPLATFGGDHRYVAEYLRDELLDSLDDELTDFLLGASVLARLTGPRCDELLGVSGSGERLEGLVRARNLFVVPLDDTGGDYRFHHMFAELLQSELRARDVGREIRLHARASGMYERAGDPDSAIRHALAAGDVGRAATLVHANAVAVRQQRSERVARPVALVVRRAPGRRTTGARSRHRVVPRRLRRRRGARTTDLAPGRPRRNRPAARRVTVARDRARLPPGARRHRRRRRSRQERPHDARRLRQGFDVVDDGHDVRRDRGVARGPGRPGPPDAPSRVRRSPEPSGGHRDLPGAPRTGGVTRRSVGPGRRVVDPGRRGRCGQPAPGLPPDRGRLRRRGARERSNRANRSGGRPRPSRRSG